MEWRLQIPPNCWYLSTKLQCVTSQKNVIYMLDLFTCLIIMLIRSLETEVTGL